MIKIPTAEEVRKRVETYDFSKEENVKQVFSNISVAIEKAIKAGNYSTIVYLTDNDTKNDFIKEHLIKLGYTVSSEEVTSDNYSIYYSITLSWHVPKKADKKT